MFDLFNRDLPVGITELSTLPTPTIDVTLMPLESLPAVARDMDVLFQLRSVTCKRENGKEVYPYPNKKEDD
jgi:hypothetical protein